MRKEIKTTLSGGDGDHGLFCVEYGGDGNMIDLKTMASGRTMSASGDWWIAAKPDEILQIVHALLDARSHVIDQMASSSTASHPTETEAG